jgi:hypothetical protein
MAKIRFTESLLGLPAYTGDESSVISTPKASTAEGTENTKEIQIPL